jgi:ABC-2 type transport system permease protein
LTTIHDQGYRRYAGTRAPHGRTWLVIAREGVRTRLRQRRFLALLLLAWLPFVVRAVQMYLAANVPQMKLLAPTPDMFRSFLEQQGVFVFFITIFVGAGIIANDRRANALQIYLSKPLTRVEYVAGKLATLLVFLIEVTWLPAMMLLVLQVAFAGSFAFLGQNLFLVPAITLYSAIQALVTAFAILALSSLSKSGRFVALMYAGLIFFTQATSQVLRRITGTSAWVLISPGDLLEVISASIFRVNGTQPIPLPLAVLVVVALVGLSAWILERKVRAVEVVA